jgi:hypothetical protein
MQVWRRPYPLGAGRWIVALWEAGALVFLYRTTVDLYGLSPRNGTLLALTLTFLWAALCVRLTRMGVYVGDGGIQIRGLVMCRTIAWPAVERIVVDRVPHRFMGITLPAGRVALIELHDGTRVNSSLSADGVDFKFSPARFREACDAIRQEHLLMTRVAEPSVP